MDKNESLVSVVMPVYMGAQYIRNSIDSVLTQTHVNLEFIIVDDCSPDDSNEIIERYLSKDDRVRYIRHQRNTGCASARNTGMEQSRGRFIAFIDQDDLWINRKLEKQLKYLENTKTELSCCGVSFVDKKGRVTHKNSYPKDFHLLSRNERIKFLINRNIIDSFSTIIMDRSVLSEVGYLDKNIYGNEDFDYWLRIVDKHAISFDDDVLVKKAEDGDNYSWKNTSNMLKNSIWITKKYSELYKINNVDEILSRRFLMAGLIELIKGNMASARGYIKQSLSTNLNIYNTYFRIITIFHMRISLILLKLTVRIVKIFKPINSRWFLYLE